MWMDTNPDKNPRPVMSPRHARMGLSVLALPALLVTMDLSVLFLAVPALSRDLEPSSTELLWITDVYGFFTRFDDVMQPVAKAVTSSFTVATAAARHMVGRGTGVILVMAGGREAISNLGGSHVAWAALAGLCRQLAAELGPQGVRVVWLLSPGSPKPDEPDPDAANLLLPRRPSYPDVANAAVFAASDWAATMTATEINLTAGAVVD